MILITGGILARAETFDELLALSRAHVARSRAEPGCLSHAVFRDVEAPLRLVFVERWADAQSVAQHFMLPASRSFVKTARSLAAQPPDIHLYEATPADELFK